MSARHITNGDAAAGIIREFIHDPVIVTADPLFERPPPRSTAPRSSRREQDATSSRDAPPPAT